MKLGILTLLCSSWLSVGGELPGGAALVVESATGSAGAGGGWRASPGAVCWLTALSNGSAAALHFRYAFESRPNETYLLKRQFTLWSNGTVQGSVTLSNLVSGTGATRWETNEIVGRVEQGGVTFRVGEEVVGKFQTSNSKLQEDTEPQMSKAQLGVGLARVTLEHYDIACANCGEEAEPGRPGLVYRGKELRFSLGRTWQGQAVGELALTLEASEPLRCQPSGLRLLALPESVTVVRRDGALRQVGARQCLADILKLGEHGCQILFYPTNALLPQPAPAELIPTNGLTPSVRWILAAPPGEARARRLTVVEENGSLWVTNLYSWTDSGWELLAGNGLRKEVFTRQWDASRKVRTERWQTFEPADNRLVAQTAAQYRLFSWGEELVAEVVGVNGEGGTNRFSYYEAPGSVWTGRLREVVRSDGSWERYEYDPQGRLLTQWSPFGNTPREQYQHGRSVSYDYEPWRAWGDTGEHFPLRPRTTTESIGGRMVGKSYCLAGPNLTVELRCATPSRAPFDGPMLGTTNRFYQTDAGTRTRLKSVEHPDGTMETFQYSRGPFTTTELHCVGEPDAAHTDIVSGQQTMTVLGAVGQVLLQAVYDLAPGRTNLLVYREAYTYLDALQRSCVVSYLDGTSNVVQFACCGLDSRRERDGVFLLYAYDGLKRIQSVLRLAGSPEPVTTRYGFDAANRLVSLQRIGQGGRDSVRLRAAAYDTAGRVLFETNGLGGVTAFTYGHDAAGRRTNTREHPDGGRRTESFNRDGTLHVVSGTAVHGLGYEYGVSEAGWRFVRETKLNAQGEPTGEWVTEYVDLLGRAVKTEYPDGASSQQHYNAKGQLSYERDPDGVLTLYGYNARGERDTEAVRTDAANMSEAIAFTGTDRVSQTIRDVVFNPAWGANVERRRRYVWGEVNSGASNLVTTLERSVDGLRTWQTVWNDGVGTTNYTELALGPEGVRERSEYAPDGSWSYSRYRCGRLELFQARDSLGGTNAQTRFRYDAHERLWQEMDLRQGTLSYSYNHADLVARVTREATGNGQKALTTRTDYNLMLQATNVVLPGGQRITTEYGLTGEIQRRHGWHSFPVAYTCDYAGRVKSMTTWRNARDTNTATVTVWNYDPQRGWLKQKRYADGTGPDYEHTPAGKLRKRTWAREVTPGSGLRVETAYGYNAAGDLETVSYNDARTPDLRYEYDRCGRLQMVTQALRSNPPQAATTRLTYTRSGLPTSESYTAGPLLGLMVTNAYDPWLWRTNLSLRGPGAVLDSVTYRYDSSARLKTVSQPAPLGARPVSATYTYEPGAPLIKQVEFREGDTPRLVCTRRYDAAGRPLASAHSPAGSPTMTHDYLYDETGQVTRTTLTDCSYWLYSYDALGQLRRGLKYRSDQTRVRDQQFEYDFDDTGARAASRSGESRPDSARKDGVQSLAPLRYDADGNLTNDGRWTFSWDAENRLVRLVTNRKAGTPEQLDFAYDWRGRRIQKEVSAWNTARQQFVRVSQLNFVYDDWHLLAVLNAERALLTSFTWGLDLNPGPAGTTGGGAGGLLLIREHPASRAAGNPPPDTYFAAYDGHGNLVGLVSARDGKTVAYYDYGPFGEPLPATPSQVPPPFKFQTRYADEETGFLYCGYRYYDPGTGRWLNREPPHEYAFWKANSETLLGGPADERGLFGPEDYVYLANAPVGNIDALGLASSCDREVQNALRSRGNRKLLRQITKAGFPLPRVAGSDTERYCSFPGFLGDYDCPKREGKICCGNIDRAEDIERTTRHELVHALDCCRNGLETCHDHICSEVVAYYMADCERFVNRLQCALDQVRSAMAGDTACAAQVAAMTERSAWKCVQDWKKRENGN
jgi:RHS repeat-associated protein